MSGHFMDAGETPGEIIFTEAQRREQDAFLEEIFNRPMAKASRKWPDDDEYQVPTEPPVVGPPHPDPESALRYEFENFITEWFRLYTQKYGRGWYEGRYRANVRSLVDLLVVFAAAEVNDAACPIASMPLLLPLSPTDGKSGGVLLRATLTRGADLYGGEFITTLLPGEYIKSVRLYTTIEIPSEETYLAKFVDGGWGAVPGYVRFGGYYEVGDRLVPAPPNLHREILLRSFANIPADRFNITSPEIPMIPTYLFYHYPLHIEVEIWRRYVENGTLRECPIQHPHLERHLVVEASMMREGGVDSPYRDHLGGMEFRPQESIARGIAKLVLDDMRP